MDQTPPLQLAPSSCTKGSLHNKGPWWSCQNLQHLNGVLGGFPPNSGMPKGKASASALLIPVLSVLFHLFLLVALPTGSITYDEVTKERTLAMIKPDGMFGNYSNKIRDVILESGFHILKETTVQLDEGNAKLFYAEHSAKRFFPRLIRYMISGPVIVMILEKSNAISDWRALIGPTDPTKAKISHPESIRAMCGTDIERNCVHGSDSSESAAKEITFFFGEMMLSGFSSSENYLKHDEL